MANIYDFNVLDINGKDVSLQQYRGQVLMIVNTASKCGFTRQYGDLQDLYLRYKDRGLRILGFPCNQFGFQEPGSEDEIKSFCEVKFQVSFDLFAKVDVNGKDAHPLFQFLSDNLRGVLGTSAIKWNFTKFLIGKDGTPLFRFSPADEVRKIEPYITDLLS